MVRTRSARDLDPRASPLFSQARVQDRRARRFTLLPADAGALVRWSNAKLQSSGLVVPKTAKTWFRAMENSQIVATIAYKPRSRCPQPHAQSSRAWTSGARRHPQRSLAPRALRRIQISQLSSFTVPGQRSSIAPASTNASIRTWLTGISGRLLSRVHAHACKIFAGSQKRSDCGARSPPSRCQAERTSPD